MRSLLFVFMVWATGLAAQTYPQYQSTSVNDYANLLPPDQEAALVERLETLKADTGVEMTVLTLGAQAAFSPDQSLEAFATGLFNTWGIGDAQAHDGVLVLVLRTDRAMRIELGAGYDRDWDLMAKRVVEQYFLPAFREDDYAAGITTGVEAVIDKIVLPFRAGEKSPVRAIDPDRLLKIVGAVVLGSIAAIMVIVRFFRAMIHRLRKCPDCGRGGLNKTRLVTAPASPTIGGRGINRFHCSFCDYSDDQHFTTSKLRTTGTGSHRGRRFGGGRSGGGGASGRW